MITNSRKQPFILKDIFNLAARQHELTWEPFAEGVEIFWIYKNGEEGSAAALIKYAPGGRVELHQHMGFEHIIVLSGSQRDEDGLLECGSLMVHRPGTSHSIVSEEGCIVLAIYEKRVAYVE